MQISGREKQSIQRGIFELSARLRRCRSRCHMESETEAPRMQIPHCKHQWEGGRVSCDRLIDRQSVISRLCLLSECVRLNAAWHTAQKPQYRVLEIIYDCNYHDLEAKTHSGGCYRSEVSLNGGFSCVSLKFQGVFSKKEIKIGPDWSIVVIQ